MKNKITSAFLLASSLSFGTSFAENISENVDLVDSDKIAIQKFVNEYTRSVIEEYKQDLSEEDLDKESYNNFIKFVNEAGQEFSETFTKHNIAHYCYLETKEGQFIKFSSSEKESQEGLHKKCVENSSDKDLCVESTCSVITRETIGLKEI